MTEMDEGNNYWISIDVLKQRQTANDYFNYLPLFFNDGFNKAFFSFNDDQSLDVVYK